MALTLGTAARNAALNAVNALVDGGAGAGKLKIRAGATLLVTIVLADPAFAAAAAGSASAAGLPKSGTAVATGTADNYEVTDSSDVIIWSDSSVSALGLETTAIATDDVVTITSWTRTQRATDP